MSCSRRFFLIFAQKTCERMERSSVKESNWKVNVFMPKSPLFPCHDVSWGKSAACLVSSRRRAHREQGLEWKFPETLSDLFDQKDKKLKLLILVVKDHAKDIGHTAVNQSSQNWESSIWAPFAWKVTLADFQNVSARRFGSWHSKSYHRKEKVWKKGQNKTTKNRGSLKPWNQQIKRIRQKNQIFERGQCKERSAGSSNLSGKIWGKVCSKTSKQA